MAKTEELFVRLVDAGGTVSGAVSGAAARRTEGGADGATATFAIDSEHVARLAKRCRAGTAYALLIRDASRAEWRCGEPAVAGDTVTAACVREGGE